MYVSSEVRHREIPESTPDSSRQASAAGGPSFLAILSEMGRTKSESSNENAAKARESAPDVRDDVDPRDNTAAATGETRTETQKAESNDTKTPEGGDGESSSTAPDTTAAQTVLPITTVLPEPSLDAEGVVTITTPPVARALTVALTAADTTAPPEAPLAPPEVSAEGVAEPIEDAMDSMLATDLTVEGDVEAPPTPPLFPKTLKAMLAEEAVRPASESPATEKSTPTRESVASTAESTNEAPQELPEGTPIPHASAMESGGVRPHSTGLPRLPMSNLPGELAQQIHLMQQEGTRTMRLRLSPENLGELQIEIQGTGDGLKVRLISGNLAVREELANQMGDLKDALEKQGLALDQASVDGEPGRRDQTPEPAHKRSGLTGQEAPAAVERDPGTLRRSTPIALGSSALNVLA